MRYALVPIAKLDPSLSPGIAIFSVHGSLERVNLDDFFRRLAVEAAGFDTVVLEMGGVAALGQAAVDRFIALSREMALRERRLCLVGLPPSLFQHQIKTAMTQREIRFHETLEEALVALTEEGPR